MRVTVQLPRALTSYTGGVSRVDVEVSDFGTLGVVLDLLAQRYPALDRRLRDERRMPRRYVNFYVDGEECRYLSGVDTLLTEGTRIEVIPSVAGG